MDLSFPEELLRSSLLIPKHGSVSDKRENMLPIKRTLVSTENSIQHKSNQASPRPSQQQQSLLSLSTIQDRDTLFLPTADGGDEKTIPFLPFITKDGKDSSHAQQFVNAEASEKLSLHKSSYLRIIQLELEKERELYNMHTVAASKAFERISGLMNDLMGILSTEQADRSRSFSRSPSFGTISALGMKSKANNLMLPSIESKANNSTLFLIEPQFNNSTLPPAIESKVNDSTMSISSKASNSKLPIESKGRDSHGGKSPFLTRTVNASSIALPKPAKVHEAIKDVSVTVKSRFFNRKPRCLLFPDSSIDEDLMITSSLDGSIQYSSVKKQTVLKSFHIPSILNKSCHAENMCHAPILNGFILSISDSGASLTDSDVSNSPSSLVFLPYDYRKTITPTILETQAKPHHKAIGTMCTLFKESFGHGSGEDGEFRFVTGGLDRSIALWCVSRDKKVVKTMDVHHSHTSAVHTIAQTHQRPEILWSGGADCKLFGWSFNEKRVTFSHKFSNRISHLLANENHPNCLLAAFCSNSDQLQIIDTRSPLSQTIPTFGQAELASTSRYLRPSWSASGNLIVMGTSSPQSRISAINVWDIRYISPGHTTPIRSIECGSERRFLACDFWPTGNIIVGLGSDCSASFVDFTIS